LAHSFQVRIEKLVYGGHGLAHANGQTIFVPFTAAGEELMIEPLVHRKKLVRGRAIEILAPSPDRVAAICPHFGTCGGCHYQHLTYATQLRTKTEILRETLRRIGGVNWEGPISLHESPPFGYRNRAQWAVHRDGPSQTLGYFMAGTSSVCPVSACPVLSPRLGRCLVELQALLSCGGVPGNVVEIEAFADSSDEQLALNVAFESFAALPEELAAAIRSSVQNVESLLLLDRKEERFELFGPGYISQQAGKHRYRVSHLSFYQVNRFLTADLLDTLLSGRQGSLALDLFAGVGFFSLPVAEGFNRVVAVDANAAAMRDLRVNVEVADANVVSQLSSVDVFLHRFREKPDLVVLDPPRAGLGPESAARLAVLGPAEIAYLSCDPATLARDLAVFLGSAKSPASSGPLQKSKYTIAETHLFDLFPQTYHIETLVQLKREP
jgi:23S rRNA (uracil1939-C5)-methyltransferase